LNADEVTDAMIRDGDRLISVIEGASTQLAGEASLLITGVQVPTLNGVLTLRPTATAADVARLLDIVAATGLPHSLQLRPGCSDELVELARARGLVEDEAIPLMAMERNLERVREGAEHPEMTIRLLEPEECEIHVAIGAEAFQSPPEAFERLITPAVMRVPGHRTYLGTVDGEAVTTAIGSTLGDYVGIFDVATPERYRGRGYAAAVTARAVLDGFEAGASLAYLQSSAMGLKVYERIGFRTLEVWPTWVTAS
jgi:N-acetylglutamate synthase